MEDVEDVFSRLKHVEEIELIDCGELESLDAQFLRENTECTTQIPHLMEELHSLAGRLGYCETDRGFHRDCELLYADVDTVVDEVQSLDRSCFM